MQKALHVMRFALAAATAAVCALLCWQVVDIYRLGSLPENFSAPGVRIHPVFSRQIVVERLTSVAPFLFVYLLLAAVGLILRAASSPEKDHSPIAPEDSLALLRARVSETPPEANRERRRRRNTWLAAAGIITLCGILCGNYLLRRENFTSLELEYVMGQMLLHTVPWMAIGLTAAIAASVCAGQSVRREIALLKAAPKRQSPQEPIPVGRSAIPAVRAVLYITAAALVTLGVMNGGLWDVLVKAVNICTECIGLG